MREIGGTRNMVTYISKDDLTDILDTVFAKYDIKIASGKQKVIKSTTKKAKSSKASKPAKVESYRVDGEKFFFIEGMVTKGQTYKDQTKGGNKLHTVVIQVTEEQLEKLFSTHGNVQSANIIGNKGFGFVELSDNSEAEKAKEALDGTDFEGRTLRVDEARPKRERSDRSYSRRY